jgi:hypothetical protein
MGVEVSRVEKRPTEDARPSLCGLRSLLTRIPGGRRPVARRLSRAGYGAPRPPREGRPRRTRFGLPRIPWPAPTPRSSALTDRLDPRNAPGGRRCSGSLLRSAVELRPEECRCAPENLIGPAQLPVLPLELRDACAVVGAEAGSRPLVGFLLYSPSGSISCRKPSCSEMAVSPPSVTPRASRHSRTQPHCPSQNSSGNCQGPPWVVPRPILPARNGAPRIPGRFTGVCHGSGERGERGHD